MQYSILFTIAIFGTLARAFYQSGSKYLDDLPARCCNGKLYYNFKEYCCKGVIYLRNNSDPKFCCNDQIIANPYSTNGECCNGKLYDKTKDLCCGKTLYPSSASFKCCGEKIYDYSKARCINNQIKNIPAGITNAGICKEAIIDVDKFMCCEDYELVKKETKTSFCCGKLPFDYKTQLCCVDRKLVLEAPISDTNTDWSCCGKTPFDFKSNFCCNDKIIPNPNRSLGCCGVKTFNYSSEFCCGNKIYRIVDTTGKTQWCCNGVAYDPKKSFCCDNGLRDIPAGAECAENCSTWSGITGTL